MLIRTYADIERLEGEVALSPAEKKLIEGCKHGELTTLGNGTRPKRPSKARTIRADLLRYLIIGGCEQCRVHEKGVQLEGAWIVGELDLSFASAKGAVLLLRCAFAESIVADQANFDRLVLNGSSLPGLNAGGAKIKGQVFLDNLKSTGEVSLSGAEIGGQLSAEEAELNGGEGAALNAQGATIRGGAFLDNLKSTGEVSLSGAEIGAVLSAKEAELNGGEGDALNAHSATIRGGVFLDNLKSTGEVSFAGAEIGGQLSAEGAELNGGEGRALNAQGATIRGGTFLRKLKSTGEVSFSGAEIGGQLSFNGAELNGGEGMALNAQRMTVLSSLFWWNIKLVTGTVHLDAAHLGDLVDDEQSWNTVSSLGLVGMTYENLVGPHNLPFRKRWLQKGASHVGQFHPQPYQQLAKFYRETGHRHEAREILIEKEREQRMAVRASIRKGRRKAESDVPFSVKTALPWSWDATRRWISFYLSPWLRIGWNWFWDVLIRYIAGYGYKPWLSLAWLAGMIGIIWTVAYFTWDAGDFAPNSAIVLTSPEWKAVADLPEVYASLSENEKQMIVEDMTPAHPWSNFDAPGKDYESFYSLAYALDVVVPVLDLGQTDAWAPSPARGDWGYRMFYLQKMFIVLGWVVTAIAAAAISGMIRRDD
ncbi:hypothetical protein [Rhizobium sp. SL42]|uniref:hypothetical protein n=1 Tax=Rhizobium sp. SL42 TaxID=2806346 RepID=UPI001F173B50|nr:hypothetical protein [Rhizobium sp. SL42]UJW76476.1 hypothetical protein IM739_08395 [Rhizobium sp. SL42]